MSPDRAVRRDGAPPGVGISEFFMKVLKDRKILKKDFIRALERGDEVVGMADRIARDIVHEARSEADAIREAARAEGFEAAKAEAAGIVISAGRARDTLLKKFEGHVIDLALEAASMIVKKARELDPAAVEEVYRRALAAAQPVGPVRIRVAPGDYETALTLAAPEGETSWSVSVVRDASVGEGGCIVESEAGMVDSRLETQIEAVRRALLRKPVAPERERDA